MAASATLVLPSGAQYTNPGLIHVDLDPDHGYKVTGISPPQTADEDPLDIYRRIFAEAGAGVLAAAD